MTEYLSEKLLGKLACPNCKANVFVVDERLECENCGKIYEIFDQIPELLTEKIDLGHLKEEEELFQKMRNSVKNKNQKLSTKEWEKSKNEFWAVVSKNLKGKKADILNIGCGYDNAFVALEQEGHYFTNMDIIDSSLKYLQEKHGAKYCVLGDINNLPFRKEVFDTITCVDVLHHEEKNLEKILTSIHRSLKKGGEFYLQDVNAWGLFQFYKSIFLPKSLHKFLRKLYHKTKGSEHVPAEYEFPTSLFKMKKELQKIGFSDIAIYKNKAYPEAGSLRLKLYGVLNKLTTVSKYNNFHYFISAKK